MSLIFAISAYEEEGHHKQTNTPTLKKKKRGLTCPTRTLFAKSLLLGGDFTHKHHGALRLKVVKAKTPMSPATISDRPHHTQYCVGRL